MGLRKFFRRKKPTPVSKLVKVGNFELNANYEHPIEEYLTSFKYYSRNLPRIARLLAQKYENYTIIDVGANIGDTIALLRTYDVFQKVVLVEGDPTFLKYLKENLSQFKDYILHETFLGETNEQASVSIDNAKGTASLIAGQGKSVAIQKLDNLIENNNINEVKLLKVDTDGFDFKILRGALATIRKQKPVLFFEYDAEFLKQQNEDGLSIFDDLIAAGYDKIVYYDNFGKLLLSTSLNEKFLMTQLFEYVKRKADCAFPYYDVCIFHQDDNQLADHTIKSEMDFFA